MRNPSSPIVTRTVPLAQWTAASCGTGIPCTAQKNRNYGPPSAETEMVTSLVTRTMTEIAKGNVKSPKRAITDIVLIGLTDALHGTKTMTAHMSMVLMANAQDRMCVIAHLTAAKQSRDVK